MTLVKQILRALEVDPLAPHALALAGGDELPAVRRAFAATRLVMDQGYADVPHSPHAPGWPEEIEAHVDWDGTLALRKNLADHGLGIAEAMDTAQRFQVGWAISKRLIEETGNLAPAMGFVAGAGTDHLEVVEGPGDLVRGVTYQARFIQEAGGVPILLPMPWLAENSCDEDTFVSTYSRIIEDLDGPVLIHWLGPAFMPTMKEYFPGRSFTQVMASNRKKVVGAKLSLLDADFERAMRRDLVDHGQVILTGDDLNFPGLIEGEDQEVRSSTILAGTPLTCGEFSHALLGILDGISRPAALALNALAQGELERYRAIMDPCAELGAHLFAAPTWSYRAGLAHLAWLAGLQQNSMLPNHEERARDGEFFKRAALLAARAGVFADRELTRERVRREG